MNSHATLPTLAAWDVVVEDQWAILERLAFAGTALIRCELRLVGGCKGVD